MSSLVSYVCKKYFRMKFSFGKLKSALQKNNANNEVENAQYLETLKAAVEDKPFAISERNIMFTGMKELAGYFYFRVVVFGQFKIKTFKGAELTITCKNTEIKLKSDMDELASDYGMIPNSFITSIDFEIDKNQIEKLNTTKIESLRVVSKKQDVTFTALKS